MIDNPFVPAEIEEIRRCIVEGKNLTQAGTELRRRVGRLAGVISSHESLLLMARIDAVQFFVGHRDVNPRAIDDALANLRLIELALSNASDSSVS